MGHRQRTTPKVCAACHRLLPRSAFDPIIARNGTQNGWQRRCRSCREQRVPIRGEEKKPRTCLDCGTPIVRRAKRCRLCQNRRSGAARAQPLSVRLACAYTIEDRGFVTPCWIWQRSTGRKGYGHLHHEGRMIQAHRLFYQERYGPLPDDVDLHHRCNQPSCVRPGHLEPLTRVEHMATDGRLTALVSRNRRSTKLNWNQVREIRRLAETMTQAEIARRFGISPSRVCYILNNKAWRE